MSDFLPLQEDETLHPSSPKARSLQEESAPKKKSFPKGAIILDKNGKPCRSCTSFRDWAQQTAHKPPTDKSTTSPPATTATSTSREAPPPLLVPPSNYVPTAPEDCPADVETLGHSTWTLLHTIAATYPSSATPTQQSEMKTFMTVFSRIYPCWVCAEDFQGWVEKPENKLQVEMERRGHLSGRSEFARWMCNAHNEVNEKLGKGLFDCSKVEERWRTGWKDGRCD